MHVNKTKFERNNSLECYHMHCIGKTKHTQAKEVYLPPNLARLCARPFARETLGTKLF